MDRVVKGILIILWLALLTSGCVTTRMYKGEQLPREQIAIIKGGIKYYVFASLDVKLTAVDGIPIYASSVEVLPGWHEIVVSVDAMIGGSDNPFLAGMIAATRNPDCYSLRFYAMPGHKYRVKSSFWKTKDALVTVVDTGSGEILASQSRKSFQTYQGIMRKYFGYWQKPDVSIEQLKQDYSECMAKDQEKLCMEEKGYFWVHTNP